MTKRKINKKLNNVDNSVFEKKRKQMIPKM